MDREPGTLHMDAKTDVNAMIWAKIIFIGDSKTGKTSIIKHFCDSEFTAKYRPTVGVDYGFKQQSVDDKEIKLNLWDLSGHPDFLDVRNELYDDTDICLLTFDVTNRSSFEALESWIEEIQQYSVDYRIVSVAANKIDLDGERLVSNAEGKNWADKYGLSYYEVSVLKNSGVAEMFQDVLRNYLIRDAAS